MAFIPIDKVGEVGIVKETSPWQLPPNVWSDGNNIKTEEGSIKKTPGYSEVMATCPFAPYYILPYEDANGNYYWLAFGTDDIAVWDFDDGELGDWVLGGDGESAEVSSDFSFSFSRRFCKSSKEIFSLLFSIDSLFVFVSSSEITSTEISSELSSLDISNTVIDKVIYTLIE